jgi:hypothetical protein
VASLHVLNSKYVVTTILTILSLLLTANPAQAGGNGIIPIAAIPMGDCHGSYSAGDAGNEEDFTKCSEDWTTSYEVPKPVPPSTRLLIQFQLDNIYGVHAEDITGEWGWNLHVRITSVNYEDVEDYHYNCSDCTFSEVRFLWIETPSALGEKLHMEWYMEWWYNSVLFPNSYGIDSGTSWVITAWGTPVGGQVHTFDAFASTWLSSADGYRWSVNSELLVPNPYAVESASVVSFYQDNYIRHGVALSYGPFILFELSTPVFVGPDSSLCVHVTTLPPDNILRYVGTIQISLPTGTLSIVISTVSASIYGCGISPHMVDEEQILIRVVVPVP